MEIKEKENFNLLIPQKGYKLRNRQIEENEEPYYFKEAYLPKTITIKECDEKFIELEE